MMKRFWIMLAAAAVLAGSGCVEPVVFAEVFQLKKDQKIYTACNIWYTDPENIDCRNIQQGSFIPVGTEIEPVGTDEWSEKITFKAAGKKIVDGVVVSQPRGDLNRNGFNVTVRALPE